MENNILKEGAAGLVGLKPYEPGELSKAPQPEPKQVATPEPPKPKFDRVGDWDAWAKKMHDYIAAFTVQKYGGQEDEFDLMVITEPRICIWNILKYALRLWKGKGKIHDLHKISHYAQMAYTLSKGDLTKAGITNEKGD